MEGAADIQVCAHVRWRLDAQAGCRRDNLTEDFAAQIPNTAVYARDLDKISPVCEKMYVDFGRCILSCEGIKAFDEIKGYGCVREGSLRDKQKLFCQVEYNKKRLNV